MYISEKHQPLTQLHLSDKEYLALQIWQLEHLFSDFFGAVKDVNLNFVAVNDGYVHEFGFDNKINVETSKLQFDSGKMSNSEIRQQEQNIIDSQEMQDSGFFIKNQASNALACYLMRKRPIINPATKRVVGILIILFKHKIGRFRTHYIKHLLNLKNPKQRLMLQDPTLSEQNHKVMLCLLFGFHSRKEIAAIISENSQSEINENKIKNQLNALYEKFECSTSSQLMQKIITSEIDLTLPSESVKEGNYLFVTG